MRVQVVSKNLDENDRLKAGVLPADPEDDATLLHDAPRVLTVRQLLEGSVKRATSKRERGACLTGHWELDKLTGGVRPGHVWFFGAETNWGKSSHAMMLADINLRRELGVLIVSFEDSEKVYADRLMCRRTRVNASRLRDGRLLPEELSRCAEEVNRAEDSPVFLDAIGKSVEWACGGIRGLCEEHPDIHLIIVDYLQEARSEKRQQDRRNEVSYAAAALRSTIKNLGRAGVILSQLTVEDGERPNKYSIRDSKDAANGAEAILLGFYSSDGGKKAASKDDADASRVILVAKSKDGPTGYCVTQRWNKSWAGFELEEDPGSALPPGIEDVADDFAGGF